MRLLTVNVIVALLAASSLVVSGADAVTFSFEKTTADSSSASGLIGKQLAALNTQIESYASLAKEGGWPKLAVNGKLEPGDTNNAVPVLREILTKTGDFNGDTASPLYDEALAESVKRFQTRHGLEADGVLGKGTINAINTPAVERLAQLQVNADRLKSFLDAEALATNADRSIIVNIPAFQLYALERGEVARKMKVIIGKNVTRTPLLASDITRVHFNPTWNVPYSIASKEMLPKLQNDPSYLARNGYTLTDSEGSRIDANSVDWNSVGRRDFNYRIAQRPGSGNALGKIKFHMPDTQAIYLHDTAKPALFAESFRALSHGCIRVEDPKALAHFVLGREAELDGTRIDQMYESARQQAVSLENPVPVRVVYWTAWVDDAGTPHFYGDVYNKDGQLIAEKLKSVDGMQLAAK